MSTNEYKVLKEYFNKDFKNENLEKINDFNNKARLDNERILLIKNNRKEQKIDLSGKDFIKILINFSDKILNNEKLNAKNIYKKEYLKECLEKEDQKIKDFTEESVYFKNEGIKILKAISKNLKNKNKLNEKDDFFNEKILNLLVKNRNCQISETFESLQNEEKNKLKELKTVSIFSENLDILTSNYLYNEKENFNYLLKQLYGDSFSQELSIYSKEFFSFSSELTFFIKEELFNYKRKGFSKTFFKNKVSKGIVDDLILLSKGQETKKEYKTFDFITFFSPNIILSNKILKSLNDVLLENKLFYLENNFADKASKKIFKERLLEMKVIYILWCIQTILVSISPLFSIKGLIFGNLSSAISIFVLSFFLVMTFKTFLGFTIVSIYEEYEWD